MAARLVRLLKFNLVSAVGIGINMGVLWTCTEVLGIYYLLSNLCGIAAAMLWNFIINLSWTWRQRTAPASTDIGLSKVAAKSSLSPR